MGGETIRDILSDPSAEFIKKNVNLVLQPMTKAEILRKWLAENGFTVTKEVAVKDSHVYTVIQACYSGEPYEISEAQCYYGKLRRTDPLTKIYIAGIQDRLHTKAHGLADAGDPNGEAAVRKLIAEINDWLAKP